jgi:hypothetical protein
VPESQGEHGARVPPDPGFLVPGPVQLLVFEERDHVLNVLKRRTSLNRLLVINKGRPGRITIILVKENLGY